tara:strand:- start:76 stop:210 length:135 start_codon:yes stop_codon:yes gene_type:complete
MRLEKKLIRKGIYNKFTKIPKVFIPVDGDPVKAKEDFLKHLDTL